ncbi:MAG TPA: hypothetical protein VHT24_10585 [Pseudacidobacterium sp.]|nr:hypothetical protein [Pseudacidobacterium sp.]
MLVFVSLDVSSLQLPDCSDEPRAKEHEEIVPRLDCCERAPDVDYCLEMLKSASVGGCGAFFGRGPLLSGSGGGGGYISLRESGVNVLE